MNYMSRSSDFLLQLEDSLMHDYHSLGLWVSMTHHFTSKYSVAPIYRGIAGP